MPPQRRVGDKPSQTGRGAGHCTVKRLEPLVQYFSKSSFTVHTEVADCEDMPLEPAMILNPHTERSRMRGPAANAAVISHYRCPDHFVDLKLSGQLYEDTGYFQFGQGTICYGQTTTDFRAIRSK